jgi:hypothetical protein
VSHSIERRAWVQCPCNAEGNPDLTTAHFCMAPVLALSSHSVRLVLPRPIVLGTRLRFEIRLDSGKFSPFLVARVLRGHRTPEAGQWSTECELADPLTSEALDLLWPKATGH